MMTNNFGAKTSFAVVCPNWGNKFIITDTISETAELAMQKAVLHGEHTLYSGTSYACVPHTVGKWENLEKQGYKVIEISLVPTAMLVQLKAGLDHADTLMEDSGLHENGFIRTAVRNSASSVDEQLNPVYRD